MAKNTNDEPVEPTSPSNRNRLRTVGWIAGGVLALGATFAAGAAVGHVGDGPRGGGPAVGQSGEREHGPRGGKHGHGYWVGGSGGNDRNHGPLGELQEEGEVHAPTDGSTLGGTVPAPNVTP